MGALWGSAVGKGAVTVTLAVEAVESRTERTLHLSSFSIEWRQLKSAYQPIDINIVLYIS